MRRIRNEEDCSISLMKEHVTADVLVVGGGAAGLFAAARLGADCRVAVAEFLVRPGMKLLASGNGRCNLTNRLAVADFIASFGEKSRFVAPALRNLPPEKLLAFFRSRGIRFQVVDDFHYFPASGRAGDLLAALLDGSYELHTSCPVNRLLIRDGRVAGAASDDREFHAEAVLIAAGSRARPALGGRGSAEPLAEQAGHHIVPPVPALAGLHTVEEWPGELAGITLEDALVTLDRKLTGSGALLFTQNGISGPAVLDLAGAVNRRLAAGEVVSVSIDLHNFGAQRWREIFAARREISGAVRLPRLLKEYFPSRLVQRLEVPDVPLAKLSSGEREKLISELTAVRLTIRGSDSWDRAMAAEGGVALDEVNPRTMESRLVKNLFFAGEFLDVTGRCGGYNLQWAFSSAALAADSVRRRLKELKQAR